MIIYYKSKRTTDILPFGRMIAHPLEVRAIDITLTELLDYMQREDIVEASQVRQYLIDLAELPYIKEIRIDGSCPINYVPAHVKLEALIR